MDHPIAFHKATDLGKAPKKLAGGPAPDLEDVFDVSVSSSITCLPYIDFSTSWMMKLLIFLTTKRRQESMRTTSPATS